MNKQEILFKLSDTADRLESAGLLREAIVLTNVMKRMAQDNSEEDSEFEYRIAINRLVNLYDQGISLNDFSSVNGEIDKAYWDYIKQLDKQINQTKDNNKRAKLVKRKLNFNYQVERLNQEYNGKLKARYNPKKYLGVMRSESIKYFIDYFKLEKAKDLNDYNVKWQNFINHMKNSHANGDPALPVHYEVPGMQQYFAKLYEQLKLKYIK